MSNNDTNVNVTINGKDETQGAVSQARNSFEGLWKSVAGGQIVANIAFDAMNKVKEGFGEVVKASEDWQNQQAATKAALQSTHDVSGLSQRDAVEYAEAISKQSPVTRDAVLAGENMLLTFTNIHKNVFPQTTQAITDMATAMNHGLTPNSQQLTDTAVLVGKALNDPATGLTKLQRVGVTFTDQQKEQIKAMEKAGNTAGAQQVILGELGKEFGGRATASAHTFQGAMEMLRNKMVDVAADALTKLMNGLNTLTGFLEKHKGVLAAVAGAIGGLGIMIAVALAPAIWGAVTAFGALALAALPWLLIGAAIGLIAYEIITHWSTLKQWFSQMWSDVKQWFSDGVNFIKRIFNDVVGFLEGIWNAWYGVFKAVVDTILAIWRTEINIIVTIFRDVINGVESIWNGIINFVSRVIGNVVNVIRNGVSGFGSMLWNAGSSLIDGLVHGIENAAGRAVQAVKNVANNVIKAARDVLKWMSPSRVFIDAGQSISQGMAIGIEQDSDKPVQSTASMAKAVVATGTASNNLPSVSTTSVSNSSSNHNITIQQLVLQMPNGATVQTFIDSLNQDQLNVKRGAAPVGGAY